MKESNKKYTECPKHWHQLFRRINTKQVFQLASKIHNDVLWRLDYKSLSHKGKELTPLHFATMFSQTIDFWTRACLTFNSQIKSRLEHGTMIYNTPLQL